VSRLKHAVSFTVNGEAYELEVQSETVLLDVIRDRLNLTGTKGACRNGECGACTVMMNGVTVNSCMVLAVEADGSEILTIEGLSQVGKLHPIQQAFIDKGAVQCGFCTPGMIMSAKGLLDNNNNPTKAEVKKAIRGNICRCTGYKKIEDAILYAAEKMRGDGQ